MLTKTVLFAIIIAGTILDTLAVSIEDMLSSDESNPFEALSVAFNDFVNPLYTTLAVNTDKNIIISPLSLYMILSLVSNGAGGSTLDELRSTLGYNDIETLNDQFKALIVMLDDIENVILHIASAAYIKKEADLAGNFLSTCMNVFQSSISKIDFKDNVHAAETINSWVQFATYNKILDIISPDDISVSTKIVLLNAIYFKSRWQKVFNEANTQPREFYISKTQKYLVPTMFQKTTLFYGEIPSWNTSFIEIPYLNESIVMIILLPNKEIELQTLENNFNWQTLVNAHRFSDDFELYLPKFKFNNDINFKDTLRKIGLSKLFMDDCDFTRLSKFPLKVSNILQKIVIEINEQGVESSVVTAAEVRRRRMAIEPMEFIVNRPFMFAIEHKPSKIPIFLGSVRNLGIPLIKDEL